uniref:Slit homolog 3 protein n=1 Tax=Cacopsylla melanoneura TaxID=428564 RepID=A0A8D9B1Q7_9HEMI
MMPPIHLLTAVLMLSMASFSNADDWMTTADCERSCKCKWIQGKKGADCKSAGFSTVPRGLSKELLLLDMYDNRIPHLPSDAFKSTGLVNLQWLSLKESNISDIHEDAFRGLGILIELDLSWNKIQTLHPGTFRDLVKVRNIYLAHNSLMKLESGLFTNLMYLQNVDVSDCQLSHISEKTFVNTTTLSTLKLERNRLTKISLSTVQHLDKLRSLELSSNSWRCDCDLRPLMEWTLQRSLYTKPTACLDPPRLLNRHWDDLQPEEFACSPVIVFPSPGTVIEVNSDYTHLRCHVVGDPAPSIDWKYNRHIINNASHNNFAQGYRYVLKGHGWANLTLHNLGANDAKGEFKCVASNPAGSDERNVTLIYDGSPGGRGVIGQYGTENWGLLLILMCAIVILLSISVLLCCCFCRKRTSEIDRSLAKKSQNNGLPPQNGELMHHITATPGDQGKSLLTVVNPVQKPPRRYDQGSDTFNGSTEMTELQRKLLDESNIGDGESRGGDSYEDVTTSGRHSNNSKLPPDLLSFPPNLRSTQPSPAGSVAEPRLGGVPAHLSPLHSPPYNMYGTLPYSRSQSPFRSPNGGPTTPQRTAGYVTIPRRPRASWSAGPNTGLELGPLTPEPVYDSCGVRTTVDGSLLSLNKIDHTKRQLPPTPNSRHSFTLPHKMSTLPHNYRTLSPSSDQPHTVIRPMPVLTLPEGYRSLQRNESPSNSSRQSVEDKFRRPTSPNRFSTQNRNDKRRASWTSRVGTPDNSITGSSDTLCLLSPTGGRNRFTPISIQPNSTQQVQQKASPTSISSQNARQSPLPFSQQQARRSPHQLNGTSKPPLSPMRKLTPIPPSQPLTSLIKSAQSIEILFEDEGEDGTEV